MFKLLIASLFLFLASCFPSNAEPLRDGVEYTYLSQLGVREATGNNDGFEVEMYLASTELGAGYAWCAAFVNWVFDQNDIKGPSGPAWSPSWFPASKVVNLDRYEPQRGDVFGIYFNSLGRIAHVGFIHKWGPTTTLTVEGNTNKQGSREGDGVYLKRRLSRQIYRVSNWIDDHG